MCDRGTFSTSDMPIFTAHVPTPSMFPTIDQGDVIFVDTCIGFNDIVLHDIVVFDTPVEMTVHRVIGFDDGNLITQGDNNSKPDGLPITESMYVGSVIYVLEYGTHWVILAMGYWLGWIAHGTFQKIKCRQIHE